MTNKYSLELCGQWIAGDTDAAPRGRREQFGVRGQCARPRPHLRMCRRDLLAAAADRGSPGAARPCPSRDGPPPHAPIRLPRPPPTTPSHCQHRQQEHHHRLVVKPLLPQAVLHARRHGGRPNRIGLPADVVVLDPID